MRVKGLIALLIVLGALVAGGYYARRRLARTSAPPAPVYATAKVQQGPLVADVVGFGSLQPTGLASLQAPTSGTVEKVFVQQGQTVHKGEVLALLSNPTIGNTIANDKVTLNKDLASLANALGTTPSQALAAAARDSGVAVAAPQTGRVTTWAVQPGAAVVAGAELAQIVNDAQVVMDVGLVPEIYQQVQAGDKVAVQFNEFAGQVPGTITSVSPNPTPSSTGFTYPAVITLQNPGLLAPGDKGTVTITTAGGAQLGLPSEATITGYGQSTIVNSPVNGTVESEAIAQNGWVTQGQTLCLLGGSAALTDIQQLAATVQSDETQLQQDQQTQSELTVTSNLNGTVGNLFVRPGDRVGQGQPLGTVFNASSMSLQIQVDELQVAQVHAGQQVAITSPGLPGQTFHGQVTSVDPMGNTNGGAGSLATYGVQIRVPSTKGLLPGMTADADIIVQTIPNAIYVPVEAIIQNGQQTEVEVLRSGKPAVVAVGVGLVNDQYAQITSGLQPGETVVTGSTQATPTLGQQGSSGGAASPRGGGGFGPGGPVGPGGPILQKAAAVAAAARA
jgi:HlyD family secretion protein